MLRAISWVLALVAMLLLSPTAARAADGKEELADNPKYKMWASFKPGATAVHVEKNVLMGEEKADFPGGVDEKTVTYTLVSVSPEKVVLRCVVVENENFGTIEAAPTKITYLAKIKKSHLEAILAEYGFGTKFKEEPEMIKVGGKELKCKVLEGSHKKGKDTFDYKVCVCEKVPGGFVLRKRTAKQDDKVTAVTTISLKSFKEATGKAPKAPK